MKTALSIVALLFLAGGLIGCGTAEPQPAVSPTLSPETPAEIPGEVLSVRDTVLAYLVGQYGDAAPGLDLEWVGRRTTPEGLIGSESYEFTSGEWVVTLSYPVVAPDMVVYDVQVVNAASGFSWQGQLDAQGQLSERVAPDEVRAVRDTVLAYLAERYGGEAPDPALRWHEARVTPEGLVGYETYEFTAEDWTITIGYPVVAPDMVVYDVQVVNAASGFSWQGQLDAQGQLSERVAPDEVRAVRDTVLAYLAERYGGEAPDAALPWHEARVTPEGLVGYETYEFTAEDWTITIGYPVVAPDMVVYDVQVVNAASGFSWQGQLDAQGQLSEPGADLRAPDPAECAALAAAMGTTLGVEVEPEEIAFTDPIGGGAGTGCAMVVRGTGADFPDFWVVAEDLRAMLAEQGWTEDPNYAADGPTGTASGWRQGGKLCLVTVLWLPSEDADCPSDRPISECDLTPEQRLYTIQLQCAVGGPSSQ